MNNQSLEKKLSKPQFITSEIHNIMGVSLLENLLKYLMLFLIQVVAISGYPLVFVKPQDVSNTQDMILRNQNPLNIFILKKEFLCFLSLMVLEKLKEN